MKTKKNSKGHKEVLTRHAARRYLTPVVVDADLSTVNVEMVTMAALLVVAAAAVKKVKSVNIYDSELS